MAILIYAPTGIAIKPLCKVFEHSGIYFELCHTEERCLQLAASKEYSSLLVIHLGDLVTLLTFYRKWKSESNDAAFIVLSRRQSGVERAHALNEGITSYHITPFSYTQLVRDVAQYEYLKESPEHLIEAHGLIVDTISHSVRFRDVYLDLTRKQFELLTLFVRHPGKVFTRVQIWEQVWAGGEYPLANTVDVHVNRLRRHLPREARRLIETVYGFGYRMRPEPVAPQPES